jgi:hypothetical protein
VLCCAGLLQRTSKSPSLLLTRAANVAAIGARFGGDPARAKSTMPHSQQVVLQTDSKAQNSCSLTLRCAHIFTTAKTSALLPDLQPQVTAAARQGHRPAEAWSSTVLAVALLDPLASPALTFIFLSRPLTPRYHNVTLH